jgi:hypothetical protein
MREGDLREEDKAEGRGLGRGHFFFFLGKTLGEGGRGEETGSKNFYGDLY